MKRHLTVLIVIAFALLLAGCGGDDKKSDSTASGNAECKDVSAPPVKKVKLKKPTQVLESGTKYAATVNTSCGSFQIALDTKQAPKTANSFAYLAKKKFYDDLSFTRIAPGFVIQGGSPNQDQTGGPGYTITEKPPADLVYSQGSVAMAKTGAEPPGTSGSQFFVVTADGSSLPPEYAPVGDVTEGYDVVQAIEALGAQGSDGPPSQPVVIDSITVAPAQ